MRPGFTSMPPLVTCRSAARVGLNRHWLRVGLAIHRKPYAVLRPPASQPRHRRRVHRRLHHHRRRVHLVRVRPLLREPPASLRPRGCTRQALRRTAATPESAATTTAADRPAAAPKRIPDAFRPQPMEAAWAVPNTPARSAFPYPLRGWACRSRSTRAPLRRHREVRS